MEFRRNITLPGRYGELGEREKGCVCCHHGFPIGHAHTFYPIDYCNLVVAWIGGREEMASAAGVGDC